MKEKICMVCGKSYTPRGTASKYCVQCAEALRKEKARIGTQKYRIRNGLIEKPGVGSGGNQLGEKNHRYTTGISSVFIAEGKRMKDELGYCERCGADLTNASPHEWCCHHKDHDRTNNVRSNFELVCKRCHQLEHDCVKNLPNMERATTISQESTPKWVETGV